MLIVALDFGTRVTGVAIGQPITRSGSPLPPLRHTARGFPWEPLDRVVQRWQPVGWVLGIPFTQAGDMQPMTRLVYEQARAIFRRYQQPIWGVDERFSSREAALRCPDVPRIQRNSIAACVLLEQWFQCQRSCPVPGLPAWAPDGTLMT